ncbi:putative Mg2+ transporter-C (MgtC) family protein [Microbacterium natoriense]|uniref:Mg2+ transporter-C (MgtC) family protein n=1 Tax=Microbacterium natoriense TaxID=284570 RepID=A0AAW8ERN1_9MICO|nr:MgtC/SapB family protein [Microbacterium natoriense]MDQ0646181.1 putative Mg2+ transporter-C (MgtC) family protein [Microbacterium natoriense]
MSLLDTGALLLSAVLAAGLGALIGLERQWRMRTAGMRTNALVSLGAALFVILGAQALPGETADPTRVAAQVVSGIGFLGAGVILREGLNIRGLTTAATLWCAAAVGSLAGAGMPLLAIGGGLLVAATNVLLRPLSTALNRRLRNGVQGESSEDGADVVSTQDFVLEATTSEKSEQRVRALLLQAATHPQLTLRSVRVRPGKHAEVQVRAEVTVDDLEHVAVIERAISRVGTDPKVIGSRWWAVEASD